MHPRNDRENLREPVRRGGEAGAKVIPFAGLRRRPAERGVQPLPTGVDPTAGLADGADPLGGHLALALGRLLRRSRPAGQGCAVAIMQFAETGLLSETFGGDLGRRLGPVVRERLAAALRPDDALVPLEGGTFALLLDGLADREAALAEVQRLRQVAGGTCHLNGLRFRLTAKVGMVLAPAHGTEPDDLVRYARVALRHAAASTTSDLECFEPAMLERLREQVWMAAELQQAVQAGRLELHYQPQYELASGAMVSTEALLRLRDAGGELIGPDRFIGIAEETGLIVEIGRWVIREACRQLAQWRAEGFALRGMAVNLSPRQLLDMELIPTIHPAVKQNRLDYADLELEITEAQMIENLPVVGEVLEEIAELGVRIAVDDFGTGYSSLAYLSRLPLHRLKIDRSLVADAEGSRRAARIVAAVVAIADELQVDVVAEGIETERQRELVAEAGCQVGQGFLMARPMPPGQLLRRAAHC